MVLMILVERDHPKKRKGKMVVNLKGTKRHEDGVLIRLHHRDHRRPVHHHLVVAVHRLLLVVAVKVRMIDARGNVVPPGDQGGEVTNDQVGGQSVAEGVIRLHLQVVLNHPTVIASLLLILVITKSLEEKTRKREITKMINPH